MSRQVDRLRQAQWATVWKAGVAAARLDRVRAGTEFRYLEGYAGPPIATTLPRSTTPLLTVSGALPPFFSGLLPEGRRLSAIRRATKTSADDELTLLLAVGTDAIGDVRVSPEDEPLPPRKAGDSSNAQLGEVDFATLFERAVSLDPDDRVGLPGAQDKVSDAMITLPVSMAGHAWILKLDPPEFPHLVANEAFFLEAARESGLDVAHAEVVRDARGRSGLLVRRFDRSLRDGAWESSAQEDGCQVLGRYPADKYHVTTEEVITGLASQTGAPIVAARTLLSQFAFAYLSCNGDVHGKNVSIHRRRGEWRVTPAYDLPSSHPYGDVSMALPIQGRDREDIGRADFVALGETSGVRPKATERVLDRLLDAMPAWLERLDQLPFDARRIHRLRRACEHRAKRLST